MLTSKELKSEEEKLLKQSETMCRKIENIYFLFFTKFFENLDLQNDQLL